MAQHIYDFTGPDGALTAPGGYPALEAVRGVWRREANRAVTDTLGSSSPILAVTGGAGDVDVSASVSPGGGDSIYVRISDAANWLRARVRKYQITTPGGYTEYEWASVSTTYYPTYTEYEWACTTRSGSEPTYTYVYNETYNHDASAHGHTGLYSGGATPFNTTRQFNMGSNSPPATGGTYVDEFHNHSGGAGHTHRFAASGSPYYVRTDQSGGWSYSTSYSWSTSNSSSPCGGVYSSNPTGNTRTAGGGSSSQVNGYYWTASQSTSDPDDYRTGNTRFQNTSSTADHWQLVLEKSTSDVITTLGTPATITAPSSLRVRAVGTSVQAFFNGNAGSSISVNEASFLAAARHGIGRGPSELNASALDNLNIDSLNTAPNAPTLVAPVGNEIFNRAGPQRFRWTPSDPDVGDSQSRYEGRYRLTGQDPVPAWTAFSGTTPNAFHDFAGNHFATGAYEWNLRTFDAAGQASPYSANAFFTAGTVADAPIITDPANNSAMGVDSYLVKWSIPDQASYQLRTVGDLAGVADPSVIYSDTGTITSATTRQRQVSFPVNGRVEHVQVRSFVGGLWTDYGSVRLTVDYTPPAVPTIVSTKEPASGSLLLQIVNPTPQGTEPTVTNNELWLDEGEGLQRYASALQPNGFWRFWLPRSEAAIRVKAKANGNNGTSSWSE